MELQRLKDIQDTKRYSVESPIPTEYLSEKRRFMKNANNPLINTVDYSQLYSSTTAMPHINLSDTCYIVCHGNLKRGVKTYEDVLDFISFQYSLSSGTS